MEWYDGDYTATWRALENDEGKEWQPKGSVFLYNVQFREDRRLEESTEKHKKRKYKEFKKKNCQEKRHKRKEQIGEKFKTEAKKEAIIAKWRG